MISVVLPWQKCHWQRPAPSLHGEVTRMVAAHLGVCGAKPEQIWEELEAWRAAQICMEFRRSGVACVCQWADKKKAHSL